MSSWTTPPSSATAPADAARAASPRRPEPRLTGAGGTDLNQWPLKVDRGPGEALESWLRRLAHRYGLTPRAALRLLGVSVLPQRLIRLQPLLDAVGRESVTEQLGLDITTLAPDPLLAALETARRSYLSGFHNYPHLDPKGLRFCPACLADDDRWQATWASPLHAVCVRHRRRLATTCPVCANVPFETPVWLTSTDPTWCCAGFYAPAKVSGRRYRPRCRADLREDAHTLPADLKEVAAQEHLLTLARAAAHDGGPVHCCGLTVTPAVALEAILDLIHAQLAARFYLTSPGEPVAFLVDALVVAVDITDQPTSAAARERASEYGLLGPQDPQAPLGPTRLIRARPHNRALETMTLLSLRGHHSIDTQLKYRAGSDLPCYPAQHRHPRDTGNLRADQGLGELPMTSIPTLLWPGLLEDAPPAAVTGVDPILVRAAASLALAKTASSRRWHLLATDLGLPATMANPIRRYWHDLRRGDEAWSTYLAWIDQVFVALHRAPPPINYQLRRAVAANHHFLTRCARDVLTDDGLPRPAGLGPTALMRVFWPIYTESDLALAPPPTPPPDLKATRVVRRLQAAPETLRPWLERVCARVADEFPDTDGPLWWRPP